MREQIKSSQFNLVLRLLLFLNLWVFHCSLVSSKLPFKVYFLLMISIVSMTRMNHCLHSRLWAVTDLEDQRKGIYIDAMAVCTKRFGSDITTHWDLAGYINHNWIHFWIVGAQMSWRVQAATKTYCNWWDLQCEIFQIRTQEKGCLYFVPGMRKTGSNCYGE